MSETVPSWAIDLLRDGRVARLGTADGAGQPLVVPISYAWDGRSIYSAVDAKPKRTRRLRRIRNILENPRVALVVDEYDEEWSRLRWVIVEGRADLLDAGADHARALDLLQTKYPQYRALGLPPEAPVIRVIPQRFLSWRYA
ncbi:MAG TPA: TIGR03668 family PPOX class F420-dependent oxidoreductase [Methylomirabilota bacterium]